MIHNSIAQYVQHAVGKIFGIISKKLILLLPNYQGTSVQFSLFDPIQTVT